jgi:hypothetical protein
MSNGAESLAFASQLSPKQPDTPPRPTLEQGPQATVDWAAVEDALDLVSDTKANLLVIGPESLVIDVIRWVVADAPACIVTPCEGGRLRLPHLSRSRGILVFRDIDELDPEGQASLYEWLGSGSGERQIVCTASPLLPSLVTTGEFDSGLYYRLNTICIRLEDFR